MRVQQGWRFRCRHLGRRAGSGRGLSWSRHGLHLGTARKADVEADHPQVSGQSAGVGGWDLWSLESPHRRLVPMGLQEVCREWTSLFLPARAWLKGCSVPARWGAEWWQSQAEWSAEWESGPLLGECGRGSAPGIPQGCCWVARSLKPAVGGHLGCAANARAVRWAAAGDWGHDGSFQLGDPVVASARQLRAVPKGSGRGLQAC